MKVRPSARKKPLRKYRQTRDEKLFYCYRTDYFQRNVSTFGTTISTPPEARGLYVPDPSQPPKNGACPVFDLPRELRDMIYDDATLGTTYNVSNFYKGMMTSIVWPTRKAASVARYGPLAFRRIPSTFASPQTVNRAIFDESLQCLIRNTTFIFHHPGDLFKTYHGYPVLMRLIKTIRVHMYEGTTPKEQRRARSRFGELRSIFQ